eukprot:c22681_g1_i2 orf=37-555(-)
MDAQGWGLVHDSSLSLGLMRGLLNRWQGKAKALHLHTQRRRRTSSEQHMDFLWKEYFRDPSSQWWELAQQQGKLLHSIWLWDSFCLAFHLFAFTELHTREVIDSFPYRKGAPFPYSFHVVFNITSFCRRGSPYQARCGMGQGGCAPPLLWPAAPCLPLHLAKYATPGLHQSS